VTARISNLWKTDGWPGLGRELSVARPARKSSGKRGHVHCDPGREALPGRGVAERVADLLHDDHENRRPDRHALDLACGPPVVSDHQQEQRGEAHEVHNRKRIGIKDPPAVETRVQKRHRSEPHQPLVIAHPRVPLPWETLS
jgi:hypothetical protein